MLLISPFKIPSTKQTTLVCVCVSFESQFAVLAISCQCARLKANACNVWGGVASRYDGPLQGEST